MKDENESCGYSDESVAVLGNGCSDVNAVFQNSGIHDVNNKDKVSRIDIESKDLGLLQCKGFRQKLDHKLQNK